MAASEDFSRSFLEEMVERVCSSLTGEAEMAQTPRNAEVGDLVLLVGEPLPRGQWRLGRVVKVVPGRDGLVRTVEVKTGASTSLVRPRNSAYWKNQEISAVIERHFRH